MGRGTFTAWPGGGGRRHPGGFLWLRADSLIIEIIQQRFARFDIPLMCLTLDEHAADTGLVTRVEAFVDMLNWRDVC